MQLNNGDLILFQGDSVTDAGRDRSSPGDLGRGYASIVGALLQADRPHLGLTVLNRGVSGNRTADLLARWDTDCLSLAPSVLSILIGVKTSIPRSQYAATWHRRSARGTCRWTAC